MSQDEPEKTPEVPREEKDLVSLSQQSSPGLVSEFWDFILHNKKWWMIPVLAVILVLGYFVFFSGTAAATLIYTLF